MPLSTSYAKYCCFVFRQVRLFRSNNGVQTLTEEQITILINTKQYMQNVAVAICIFKVWLCNV